MKTWGEIKQYLEAAGVTDDSEPDYIDIGPATTGLELYLEEDGRFRLVGSYGGRDYIQDDRKDDG